MHTNRFDDEITLQSDYLRYEITRDMKDKGLKLIMRACFTLDASCFVLMSRWWVLRRRLRFKNANISRETGLIQVHFKSHLVRVLVEINSILFLELVLAQVE